MKKSLLLQLHNSYNKHAAIEAMPVRVQDVQVFIGVCSCGIMMSTPYSVPYSWATINLKKLKPTNSRYFNDMWMLSVLKVIKGNKRLQAAYKMLLYGDSSLDRNAVKIAERQS